MDEKQVERIIVWYYRNSGYPITRFHEFRIKMQYWFANGKWLGGNLRFPSQPSLTDKR